MRPANFRTGWDGPLQLLKIVRQTRTQNALHVVSNAQNCVGFWGVSSPPPDGGTNDALPYPLVVRSFLPSAISPLCTINASIVQGSGLGPSNFVITVSPNMPTIATCWSLLPSCRFI